MSKNHSATDFDVLKIAEYDYNRRSHYLGNKNNFSYYNTNKKSPPRWSTLLYFPIAILWIEFVIKFAVGLSFFGGLFYTILFTIPLSAVLTVICTLSKSPTLNRRISLTITAVFSIWYCVQIVYNNVFGTFLVITSITNGGTGQALNSIDMIFTSILNRLVFIILAFLPLVFNIIFGKKLIAFKRYKLKANMVLIIFAVLVQLITMFFINFDASSANTKSNYNLYNKELQQNAVCERFGLFTMQRLDISHLLFGYNSTIKAVEESTQPSTEATADTVKRTAQTINTDYKKLAETANNDELKTLYEYFDSAAPSYTNEYTGMFEGYNVIFLTAESFSQYAIDKTLTPTLYKMYNEGFQFENYYSPA